MFNLKVIPFDSGEEKEASSNICFVSHKTYEMLSSSDCLFYKGNAINICFKENGIPDNAIKINRFIREKLGGQAGVIAFKLPSEKFTISIDILVININYLNPNHAYIASAQNDKLHDSDIAKIRNMLSLLMISPKQRYLFTSDNGIRYLLDIEDLYIKSKEIVKYDVKSRQRYRITFDTTLNFVSTGNLKASLPDSQYKSIFRFNEIDFEKFGIGGVDKEFNNIFRRVFSSRMLDPDLVEKLSINHCKGMILYGAPGCGKTLMARCISKMLNTKEPKIVNGPEIYNKYVGESESNIRELFKDAESDYAKYGNKSKLHMIVFDEIDSICGSRDSKNDVSNRVVNQLLAKIDGVNSLNNLLIIGMTNRLDLLDEALLRPGRFGYQIKISLPDATGRCQILKIHTEKLRDADLLDDSVDMEYLASKTKNYTGAELEEVVRSATSYNIMSHIDNKQLQSGIKSLEHKITLNDFNRAIDEVKPAYGVECGDFIIPDNIIEYNDSYIDLEKCLHNELVHSKDTTRIKLFSILLSGDTGSGKTTLISKVINDVKFPYAKSINPIKLVGHSDSVKCAKIGKVFKDAYDSTSAIVLIDNIEKLIEYVPIGPRFSNMVLQTLDAYINNVPGAECSITVIVTTNNIDLIKNLGLIKSFNVIHEMPILCKSDICTILKNMNYANINNEIIPDNINIRDLIIIITLSDDITDINEYFIKHSLKLTRKDDLYI